MAFEHFNTTPPADLQTGEQNSQVEEPTAQTQEVVTEAQGTPQTEPAKVEEQKPEEFIELFNKKYSTQYKSDDDIKGLFTLPGKVTEYEGKLKDYDELKKSVDNYKKELEETRTNNMSEFLSKPRIKQAYVAEQLIAKYPDRDPDVLSNLAMSDIDKMSDIDVLARERKMRGVKASLDNIKAVIVKELGVDPEQKPEEWDSLVTTELEIKAADARERIKGLLKDIELPKIVTKEEREAAQAKALEERVKSVTPVKEVFKKFDTYKRGEFEFVVPDEFKSKLSDVFDGMFINAGLDVNEENIATAESLKRGMFLDEYIDKILELHEKQGRTKVKEETDALLHNDTPPNTATATDQEPQKSDKPGLSDFFRTNRR